MVRKKISIAMITPWAVKCGIYTYSRDLCEELKNVDIDIYIVRLPRFGALNKAIVIDVLERIPLNKIDLIHVQEEYGLFKGLEEVFYEGLRTLGKPVITTCHSVGNFNIDKIISDVSKWVIVHNQFCMRNMHIFENISIIPHGLKPTNTIPKDEAKHRLAIDPKIPVVGYVGFLSWQKGLETIVDAMVYVPSGALLIGGGWHSGEDTTYIRSLKASSLEKLEGRCQWLGFVPDDMLTTVYGAIDLIVYPSRYGTESGAMLMAMSHGKAILASKIPPFEEKGSTIKLFNDVDDLSQKINELLKNDKLRKNYEAKSRRYARKNSWSNVALMHRELYEETLEMVDL